MAKVVYRFIISILIVSAVLAACSGSSDSSEDSETAEAIEAITSESTEVVQADATQAATEESVATVEATEAITPESTEAVQAAATQAAPSTAQPTDEATPDSEATLDATVVSLATVHPTDVAAPVSGATQVATNLPIVQNNGDHSISISYTLDRTPTGESSPDQPEFMSLLVVGSLGNLTSRTVEVSDEDLFLVDVDNNRYLAESPNSDTQPPLVGAEVPPNESFLGLALFNVPPGTIPIYLEWCIAGDCEQAVQAVVP